MASTPSRGGEYTDDEVYVALDVLIVSPPGGCYDCGDKKSGLCLEQIVKSQKVLREALVQNKLSPSEYGTWLLVGYC